MMSGGVMTIYDRKKVHFLKAYLMLVVVGAVLGFLVGAVQGGILGMAMGLLGVAMETIPRVTSFTGGLLGLVVGFFVFRWTIRKYIFPQLAFWEKVEI